MPAKPHVEQLAPHLYLQSYPAKLSDSDLADFLSLLEEMQPGLNRPFSWIADFRAVQGASARQRKMMADFQGRVAELDRLFNAGTALVVSNGLVRGLVTAVFWLAPPAYPTTVVERRGQALSWSAGQLEKRGVTVDVAGVVGLM